MHHVVVNGIYHAFIGNYFYLLVCINNQNKNGFMFCYANFYRPKTAPVTEEVKKLADSLPSSFDWRNVNGIDFVPPVRNQGKHYVLNDLICGLLANCFLTISSFLFYWYTWILNVGQFFIMTSALSVFNSNL